MSEVRLGVEHLTVPSRTYPCCRHCAPTHPAHPATPDAHDTPCGCERGWLGGFVIAVIAAQLDLFSEAS